MQQGLIEAGESEETRASRTQGGMCAPCLRSIHIVCDRERVACARSRVIAAFPDWVN
jgi:hypothetical protein